MRLRRTREFRFPSQERLGVGSPDPNHSRSGVSVRLSPHFGSPSYGRRSRVPRPQPLPLRGLRAALAALRKPELRTEGSRVPRPQPLPLRGLRAALAALRSAGRFGGRVTHPNLFVWICREKCPRPRTAPDLCRCEHRRSLPSAPRSVGGAQPSAQKTDGSELRSLPAFSGGKCERGATAPLSQEGNDQSELAAVRRRRAREFRLRREAPGGSEGGLTFKQTNNEHLRGSVPPFRNARPRARRTRANS